MEAILSPFQDDQYAYYKLRCTSKRLCESILGTRVTIDIGEIQVGDRNQSIVIAPLQKQYVDIFVPEVRSGATTLVEFLLTLLNRDDMNKYVLVTSEEPMEPTSQEKELIARREDIRHRFFVKEGHFREVRIDMCTPTCKGNEDEQTISIESLRDKKVLREEAEAADTKQWLSDEEEKKRLEWRISEAEAITRLIDRETIGRLIECGLIKPDFRDRSMERLSKARALKGGKESDDELSCAVHEETIDWLSKGLSVSQVHAKRLANTKKSQKNSRLWLTLRYMPHLANS